MIGFDKTRKTLVLFAGVAAVTLGLAHTDSARAAGTAIMNVLVTNDTAHAIPVQVTQLPATPPPPRVSTDDNLEPVTLFIAGTSVYGNDGPFVVPAGKRLVVEAVYFRIYSWLQVQQASISIIGADVTAPLAIQTSVQDVLQNGSPGVFATMAGGPVRLYVEAGRSLGVGFSLVRFGDDRPTATSGVVVGHFVNVP